MIQKFKNMSRSTDSTLSDLSDSLLSARLTPKMREVLWYTQKISIVPLQNEQALSFNMNIQKFKRPRVRLSSARPSDPKDAFNVIVPIILHARCLTRILWYQKPRDGINTISSRSFLSKIRKNIRLSRVFGVCLTWKDVPTLNISHMMLLRNNSPCQCWFIRLSTINLPIIC